jgi:hypothetical protein
MWNEVLKTLISEYHFFGHPHVSGMMILMTKTLKPEEITKKFGKLFCQASTLSWMRGTALPRS